MHNDDGCGTGDGSKVDGVEWAEGFQYFAVVYPSGTSKGACAGSCGYKADEGCWCDDACCIYNDCCEGKTATCGGCSMSSGLGIQTLSERPSGTGMSKPLSSIM
jgi:hypothetical protein